MRLRDRRAEDQHHGAHRGARAVAPGGDCVFNVPIRTAWLDRETEELTYGTGGGVVWDSTPDGEWDELRAKTAVVRSPWPPFRLLETLAARDGTPIRMERHLRRMAASADRFEFPFPGDDVRSAIRRAAAEAGTALLRVTLGDDGTVRAETRPLDRADRPRDDAGPPRTVVAARSPVDADDPFLYHKTTHRASYDRHRREAPADAWDVLLWNEDGRVTEFCRGNVVAEIVGRLLTPPRRAGLLPGCLRESLLEEGRIAEADLSLDDCRTADALWFINSARGWVRVRLREMD